MLFIALPSENQACQLYFPILSHTTELKNELIGISFSFVLFLFIVNMHVFFPRLWVWKKNVFLFFFYLCSSVPFFIVSRFNSNCRDVEFFFTFIKILLLSVYRLVAFFFPFLGLWQYLSRFFFPTSLTFFLYLQQHREKFFLWVLFFFQILMWKIFYNFTFSHYPEVLRDE